MQYKIWIELPEVKTLEEAEAHCKLANKMLNKLGVLSSKTRPLFYAHESKRDNTFYNYADSPMTTQLTERGVWLNLEYLSESPEEQKANP